MMCGECVKPYYIPRRFLLIFLAMTLNGLVRGIERQCYPRKRFWDRFIAEPGQHGIHSVHEPALRGFDCPDGSHFDVCDRGRCKAALANVMKRLGLVAP